MDRQLSPDDRRAIDLALGEAWQDHRRYLLDVAFRMLGSLNEAEDIVQEAFVRLLRVSLNEIDDVRGWLVVVVSRLCLDHLRSARSRREAAVGSHPSEASVGPAGPDNPADRVTLDDSVGMALLVVLARLTPAERVVFVLHDVFQFSFEAVGGIVGRSPAACRQLASRARRHIKEETGSARFEVEPAEQRRVAERFIAACSGGDLEALMAVLDPDVVGDVDRGGVIRPPRQVGARRVARILLKFLGPDRGVTLVSMPVNGDPGAIAFKNGNVFGLIVLNASGGLIDHIHVIIDRRKLANVTSLLNSRA